MRTAIVHEWIASYAGSEKVVESIGELYPQSPLYLLMFDPQVLARTALADREIHASFLHRMPFARKHPQHYLPLMPFAIEQHDLSDFELVISSSHAVAKSVLTHSEQLHICYMHTPIRYVHDLYQTYLKQAGIGYGPISMLKRWILHYVRQFDLVTANRPDVLVANSQYVAKRIYKHYRREAAVIYPPVDTERFSADQPRDDFYLTVTRLVPYKRVDLIVEAFAKHPDKRCIIVGDGPDRQRLERLSPANVTFTGHASDEQVNDHMQRCRAFVFAADEDFGISPVEAQAAGAPVIALARGGTCETVIDQVTGIHFQQQTVEDIAQAIERFEDCRKTFSSQRIAEHAAGFSKERFLSEMDGFIQKQMQIFNNKGRV